MPSAERSFLACASDIPMQPRRRGQGEEDPPEWNTHRAFSAWVMTSKNVDVELTLKAEWWAYEVRDARSRMDYRTRIEVMHEVDARAVRAQAKELLRQEREAMTDDGRADGGP